MAASCIQILLIEDDEEFRELLTGFLEDENYQVTAVSSGEQALEAAHRQTFDLVIADVKLGGMDGLDTLSRIKDHQSDLQGLVMTGYSTEADSIRAVKLGVGNYLKKPFTIQDFLLAVQALVQRLLQEREAREREMALLETLAWALQSVLLTLPELDAPVEVARRTRLAALGCGLEEVEAENIRLAVLAALVQSHGEPGEIPFVFKGLPRPVAGLVDSFRCGTSLEDQLVRFGVSLAEGHPVEVSEAVSLAHQQSKVLEPGAKGLLPLALALEGSGDLDGAERAFSRLAQGSGRRREAVQGRLGRARVLFARGKSQESLRELQLIAKAEQDSVFAAEAHLESGVLLARLGQREPALEALRRAKEGFDKTGGRLGSARAALALSALGEGDRLSLEQALAVMLAPHNLESFFQSAAWLFPFLIQRLQGEGEREVARGLRRYFRDLPGFVTHWMRQARSPKAICNALEAMSRLGASGYETVLSELAQDQRDSVRQKARELLLQQTGTPTAPALRLYGFGEFEAFVGDRQVAPAAWQGKKAIYFLSFLASKPGQFVPRETLVDHFWPNTGERGFKSLSQLLLVIRKALQPLEGAAEIRYLAREGSSLGLNPDLPYWHDVNEVESCLTRAARLGQAEAASEYEKAFELYRGPYMDGCYMDWALELRHALERRLLDAWLRLAETRLGQGRYQDALEVSATAVRMDSFCQQAVLRMMEAQVGLGRPEEAIRTFERCQNLLRQELETEPNTDLIRAFHQAKLTI